jgi:Immunity protein Imm1
LTAYYFGHHSEFPRWSAVSRDDAIRALAEFCERPHEPPAAIPWGAD